MNLRSDFAKIDIPLLVSVLLLVIIGILAIFSTGFDSITQQNNKLYQKQLLFFIVGLVAMAVIMFVSAQQIGMFSLHIFGIILFIVIVVTFFGTSVRNTRAWIQIGGFSLQPSEFMKLATVILLAKYLELREREMRYFRELFIPTIITFIPVLFILKQPDFGTAFVFVPVLFAMLFAAGADVSHLISITLIAGMSLAVPMFILYKEWIHGDKGGFLIDFYSSGSTPYSISIVLFAVGLIAYVLHVFIIKNYFRRIYIPSFVLSLGILLSVVVYRHLIGYQRKRILVYLNPDLDPHGSGYNVIQSKIAIGSGGWFGKGFLHGSQTQLGFLPEKSTDFIFSVISEEWGFVGAVVVLVLLAVIVYRGLKIALEAKDSFSAILATGITSIFLCHIVVNLGMVIGIIPVTGLPLSFVSYGGSNLLMSLMGVGILMSISSRKFAN